MLEQDGNELKKDPQFQRALAADMRLLDRYLRTQFWQGLFPERVRFTERKANGN